MTAIDMKPVFRGTSAEAQLILACCSVEPADERRAKVRSLLDENLDWVYLLDAAGHSASILQLYRELSALGDTRVPSEVMLQLKTFYQHNSIKNLMLIQELLRILKLMEADGFEAMAYKGPALAVQYYGDAAARMFWDLDLLVQKEHLREIKQLLIKQGYVPEKIFEGASEEAFFNEDCEYNFDRQDGKVHLEIHWDILPRHSAFNFDAGSLWRNAVPITLGGSTVMTPRAEDMLLVLCVHAGDKHQWSALRMIQDVAQVLAVAGETMDWDRVIERMRALERMNTILLGVFLAQTLLGAPVPESLMSMARRTPQILNRAALVCGRIFREGHGLPGHAEWRQYRRMLQPADGERPISTTRSILQYCACVMEPEFHDREELPPLSQALSFLHYGARIKRLLFSKRVDPFKRMR